MTEATKKTLIDLAKILGGMGVLIVLICFTPDGSAAQLILGIVMCIALVGGIIFFSGLGNPIKKLYKKIRGIK